jgi:hypothetical protein
VPGIVEREDVRVVETRGDLDLAEEAIGPDDRGKFGVQYLQRDLAVMLDVLGQIDGGHATTTNLPLEAVDPAYGRSNAIGDGCRHLRSSLPSRG